MSRIIFSVEPVRYPLTGIGRYALELGRELSQVCQKERILFFNGRQISDNFTFDENEFLRGGLSQSKVLKSWAKKNFLISEIYFKIKRDREARVLRGHESEIVHATNFVCPRFDGKKIVSFYDMSAYITPNCQEKVRLKILQRDCEYTIKNADALITISKASKQSIVDYFGYPESRIFVTPLACNREFYLRDEKVAKEKLKQLGLNFKQYSLFVGTIEPRKNIITLIKAYRRLPSLLKNHFPLVICGHSGWKSEQIFDEIYKASSEGWLRYVNYVDQATLLSLYSGAKLFCFPSLYEGFGLPVLEAMASGVPVISADNSSLPEVVGNAGILISAQDVISWTGKINALLESEVLMNELVIKGFNRAKQFSWERCALETMRVYDTVERF